jgi:hypothetical protein
MSAARTDYRNCKPCLKQFAARFGYSNPGAAARPSRSQDTEATCNVAAMPCGADYAVKLQQMRYAVYRNSRSDHDGFTRVMLLQRPARGES